MKKDVSFDIAKGIGIFLVVLGHIEYISLPLRYFLTAFHMPLFFVISGMLMKLAGEEKKNPSEFIRGKLRRMGRPYLVYSVVYLIFGALPGIISGNYDKWNTIQNAWYSLCFYGNSVLWFLPAMFFGMLLLFALRKKCGHIFTIAFALAMAVIAYFLNDYLNILRVRFAADFIFSELYFLFVMLLRNFYALFFLTAGYYGLRLYELRINRWVKLIIAVVLLIAVYVISQANGPVDMHFCVVGNPLMYVSAAIMGSFAIIFLSAFLSGFSDNALVRGICFYGVNSLTIMATHIDTYVMYVCVVAAMIFRNHVYMLSEGMFCVMIFGLVFIAETIIIKIFNAAGLKI